MVIFGKIEIQNGGEKMTRINIKHSKDVQFKDIDVGGFFTIRNALYLKVSNDYLKPILLVIVLNLSATIMCKSLKILQST